MNRCEGCGNADRKQFARFSVMNLDGLRLGWRCMQCSRVKFEEEQGE